jgi:peptidyl-prolyl cis-trans isomerase SurA
MRLKSSIRGRYVASPALALCLCSIAIGQSALTSPTSATGVAGSQSDNGQPLVLDRVIAIINGDVLLESDVQEEMLLAAIQPISIQQGQNTPLRAAQRLINRTLILQQMKEQQSITPVTDEEVRSNLNELRKQIPACVRYRCETQQGWADFLKDKGLTEQQVEDRWRMRLQILHFIDGRFQAGIRISKAEIQNYYDKTLTTAFEKENVKAPALDSVSQRIHEILMQQRVNVLLQDWLKSLRDQGSVQVLDQAYGQGTGNPDDETGG